MKPELISDEKWRYLNGLSGMPRQTPQMVPFQNPAMPPQVTPPHTAHQGGSSLHPNRGGQKSLRPAKFFGNCAVSFRTQSARQSRFEDGPFAKFIARQQRPKHRVSSDIIKA
jgi:hypothetical protein